MRYGLFVSNTYQPYRVDLLSTLLCVGSHGITRQHHGIRPIEESKCAKKSLLSRYQDGINYANKSGTLCPFTRCQFCGHEQRMKFLGLWVGIQLRVH